MVKLDVYVLHATMLSSRKKLCDELRDKLKESSAFDKVSFTYIDEFDTKDIDNKLIEKYVDLSKSNPNSVFENLLKGIHVRQLSNALKHYEALKRSATTDADANTFCLIIEDDVVYSDNVVERLKKTVDALKEYTEPWNLHFLGLPQPLSKTPNVVQIAKVDSLFKILPEISSYLTTPAKAKQMVDEFLPIRFTTNTHMSYISLEKAKDKVCYTMSTPNVFVDGSKFGVYLSSINANNKLILNQEYGKMYNKINNSDKFSPEEIKEIDKTFEDMKFNTHPEIQSLKGQFLMKTGKYQEAKDTFELCYKMYLSNDCLLNGESEFLQIYARVFKYLQHQNN